MNNLIHFFTVVFLKFDYFFTSRSVLKLFKCDISPYKIASAGTAMILFSC
jgi:hypothetical protein